MREGWLWGWPYFVGELVVGVLVYIGRISRLFPGERIWAIAPVSIKNTAKYRVSI